MMSLRDDVLKVLRDNRGNPVTLGRIAWILQPHGTASISARVRELRKPKYGGHKIIRKQLGNQHFYMLDE